MTNFLVEASCRQMEPLLQLDVDVTAYDKSSGVGHLEKVTSQKTTRAAASAILRK